MVPKSVHGLRHHLAVPSPRDCHRRGVYQSTSLPVYQSTFGKAGTKLYNCRCGWTSTLLQVVARAALARMHDRKTGAHRHAVGAARTRTHSGEPCVSRQWARARHVEAWAAVRRLITGSSVRP